MRRKAKFSVQPTVKITFVVRRPLYIFAPVKCFAYIMAILVVALSCLPCADGGTTSGKANTELVGGSEHEDDDHEDSCSPFCQCSCCAGFSISHLVAGITYEISCYSPTYTSLRHAE